jgi:hypothetical protein
VSLRANYFGVISNGGLAAFIAVVLCSSGLILLGVAFSAAAIYHVMHLKKVDVSEDGIHILYPMAVIWRHRHVPTDAILQCRFSGGHYTESGAVFVRYRKKNRIGLLKVPVDATDWRQAKNLFTTLFPVQVESV